MKFFNAELDTLLVWFPAEVTQAVIQDTEVLQLAIASLNLTLFLVVQIAYKMWIIAELMTTLH
jgi:hypothetical protein